MNEGANIALPKNGRIYIAGHCGLVGSALVRACRSAKLDNLILKTHAELDLERQAEVEAFFDVERPEYVILAAAKVGGIFANSMHPAPFIYQNLAIATNVIHAAWKYRVKRMIFLGSSCIYPRLAAQPIKEDYLLSGGLEPTNEAYAIAKIAGVKLCQSYNREYGTEFIPVMPTNLYGPKDNFNLETSHVLPALLCKIHEAKMMKADTVSLWGTGAPRREFLHVDDLAQACLFLLGHPLAMMHDLYNIGYGNDIAINELAKIIARIVGWNGAFEYDISKPDGTPRKLLDVSRLLELGWNPKIGLEEGITLTYAWYLKQMQ